MRTTVDLPDELLRQVKAKAALQGSSVKKLLTEFITNGLRHMPDAAGKVRERSELPVIPRRGNHRVPNLTAELQDRFEQEEDRAKLNRSFRR